MNDLNDKEIINYLGKLPQNVVGAVLDKTWSTRTGEIALKYSLSEEQTTILKNLVLFVMIGVENPETFSESIEKELGISNLLTEQLAKDIDNRVFQYVVNFIQEKSQKKSVMPNMEEKKASSIQTPVVEQTKEIPKDEHTDFDVLRTMSKDIEYIKNNQDPVMHNVVDKQIKSNNETLKTPEIIEQKTVPAPINLPGIEIHQEITPEIKIDDLGDSKVFVGSEFIKQSGESKPVTPVNPKPEPPKWGSNVNNGSTSASPEVKPANTQEKISVPRYTSDPYREPIE